MDENAISKYNVAIQEATKSGASYANKQLIMTDAIKGTNKATRQLIEATNGAEVSQDAMSQATKQSTLSAKAGAVAYKVLAVAGNMIAFAAIAKVIQLAYTAIDNWVHSAEKAKENAEELTNSLKDMQDTHNSNSSTISELSNEYQTLSKGVNQLGENISLTSDEYDRYHEICNQVDDIMPHLTQSYDAQGNAILTVKGNLADLNAEYDKYKQNEAIKAYNDGDAGSVFEDYKNSFNKTSSMPSYDDTLFGKYRDLKATKDEQVDYLNQLLKLNDDEMLKLSDQPLSKPLGGNPSDYNNDSFLANTLRQYGLDKNSTHEEIESIRDTIESDLQALQTDIDTVISQISSTAITYGQKSNAYWGLESESQQYFQAILNGITPEFVEANNLGTEEGMQDFVNNLISTLAENKDGINDAFKELFNFDIETTDLTPDEIQAYIQKLFDTISTVLDLDEEGKKQIQVIFGFDYVDDLAEQYEKEISKFDDLDLSAYFKENSINSKEELDEWKDVTKGATSAAEAIEMYKNTKKAANETPVSLGISETIDQLNTQLKPTFDSLKSAYQDIFVSDDGKIKFTLDNVDISTFESVKSAIDGLNEIDGIEVNYDDFDDFVKVLSNSSSTAEDVQGQFDNLASSIVNATDLTSMSSETFNLLAKSLKEMGLTNAEEVLTNIKNIQSELAQEGYNLKTITDEEAMAFIKSANTSEVACEYLRNYMIQKQLTNQPLNTSSDVTALEKLCKSLGVTGEMLKWVSSLKSAFNAVESGAPYNAYRAQIDEANRKIQELANNSSSYSFKFDGSSSNDSSSNDSSSKSSESKGKTVLEKFKDWISKLFDLIEIKIQKQSEKVEKYVSKAENAKDAGNYGTSAKHYRNSINATTKQIANEQTAAKKYNNQADKVVNKAVSMGIVSKKQAKSIKEQVQNGSMNIKNYSDKVQEVIKDYQEWYDKSKSASTAMEELHNNIRQYIQDLKDMRDAQRDTKIEKIDTYTSIGTSGYSYNHQTQNSQLNFSNSQLDKQDKAYDTEVSNISKDVTNVGKSGTKSVNKALKSKDVKGKSKKSKAYKKALNNAKKAISAKKEVSSADLKTIKSHSISVYNKLYAYNLSLENLEIAKLEQATNVATTSAERFENIAKKYENQDAKTNDKISLLQMKSNNATSAKSKNSNLDEIASQYDKIVSDDKAEIAEYQKQQNSNANTIKSEDGTGSKYKGLSNKSKTDVKGYINKAKNAAKSGRSIDSSVISKLAEYYSKGYVSKAFYESCVNYNNAIEHREEAEAQLEIDKQTAIQEKAAIGTEKFDNIKQEYTNKLNTVQSEKDITSSKQSLKTTKGIALTTSDYQASIAQSKAEQQIYENGMSELNATIQSNLKSGYWTTTSQEYLDAMQEVSDFEKAVID